MTKMEAVKQGLSIAFNSVHVLGLAVCTYLAAIEIETILVTGVLCSSTGVLASLFSFAYRKPLLGATALLTPILAVVLFLLEAVLNLGPSRAAMPFCICFLINQVVCTLVVLTQLNLWMAGSGANRQQVTIRMLLVCSAGFAVFFAVTNQLLDQEHDWLMSVALGLLGLTFVGLTVVFYRAYANRQSVSKM